MVKTLERDRYALCEKHVIVPFCCSHQMYRYLAGCFGLISCRHYLGGSRFFCQEQEKVAKREKFRLIRTYHHRWPVSAMCRVLQVSEQGYYYFLRRSDSVARDRLLMEQIHQCLREEPENANYGVRRIIWWLRLHRGYTGGSRRIYRICKENNLIIRTKRRPNGITREDRAAEKSENLIKQDFSASKPNEKMLTDITQIACAGEKLYLAAVLDCFDGSIR